MQIIAENITYTIPSGRTLFHNLSFSIFEAEKSALVGDNGSGKSTLLKILNGCLQPDSGSVKYCDKRSLWFIPQHFGQYNDATLARMLRVKDKIDALNQIEQGSVDPRQFEILSDDWSIRERIEAALEQWGLTGLSPSSSFNTLSGGEKTRAFLAGINIHHPNLVLMDEPTNHLDRSGRKCLYSLIEKSTIGFLIVSHDRELLNFCQPVYELSSLGIKRYGGNYDFYELQKQIKAEALDQRIGHTKKALSDARHKQRKTIERKKKRNARAAKKATSKNLPRIMLNTARNRAEDSTSRLNEVREQKIAEKKQKMAELKRQQRDLKQIRFTINRSPLHDGKVLFEANRVNFIWPGGLPLWSEPLRFKILSGERIHLTGNNGSGKSTLIRMLNGELKPASGNLTIQSEHRFLLDQEYMLIDRTKTVLEQAVQSNEVKKPDHELKTLLHRYLFEEKMWDQPCRSLSGGEMMRLSLCCLALQTGQPDTIILDEPSNNLDLQNIKLLTEAISSYLGTLIVASHDSRFTEGVRITRVIHLE